MNMNIAYVPWKPLSIYPVKKPRQSGLLEFVNRPDTAFICHHARLTAAKTVSPRCVAEDDNPPAIRNR